ncbi:MAG TPA: hypothetical protein VNI01_01800, partial [Elusimicrobiota bacterium]|nr:hypothetical protein [Elusimicrobiota bacterium]
MEAKGSHTAVDGARALARASRARREKLSCAEPSVAEWMVSHLQIALEGLLSDRTRFHELRMIANERRATAHCRSLARAQGKMGAAVGALAFASDGGCLVPAPEDAGLVSRVSAVIKHAGDARAAICKLAEAAQTARRGRELTTEETRLYGALEAALEGISSAADPAIQDTDSITDIGAEEAWHPAIDTPLGDAVCRAEPHTGPFAGAADGAVREELSAQLPLELQIIVELYAFGPIDEVYEMLTGCIAGGELAATRRVFDAFWRDDVLRVGRGVQGELLATPHGARLADAWAARCGREIRMLVSFDCSDVESQEVLGAVCGWLGLGALDEATRLWCDVCRGESSLVPGRECWCDLCSNCCGEIL